MKLLSDDTRTPVIFARFTFVSIALLLGLATPAHALTLDRGLMHGYSGPDVSALQQFLKDLGFYSYPEITGYYGTSTTEAVAAFQKTKGIPPLGGVGLDTRAAISAMLAASGQSVSARPDEQTLVALYTQPIELLQREVAAIASTAATSTISAPLQTNSAITSASSSPAQPLPSATSTAPTSAAGTASSPQPDYQNEFNRNAPGNGWTPGFGGGGGGTAASAATSAPTPAPYVAKAVTFDWTSGPSYLATAQPSSLPDSSVVSGSAWVYVDTTA